jgi:L-amino acid N-acyltransferase YncA
MADGGLQRLRARLATQGAWPTLRKAFGDHVFRHSASVMMELHGADARVGRVRIDDGMELIVLRKGDAVPPLCPWLSHRHGDFAAMLAAGKLGFFVLRHEVAVGCAWAALSDHHDARMREHYRVAPGEAYHYSLLLDPAERPRGTAMPFVRWMVVELRAMGIDRMFGVIDRDNRASYRIHQHIGYRESGMLIRHFHVLRRRWTRMTRYEGTLGLADPRLGRRPS